MATSTEPLPPGWSAVAGPLYHGIPCLVRIRGRQADADAAWTVLQRIDAVFNVHRPDSELARINAAGPGRHAVSPWLADCLATAMKIEDLSDGAWSAAMLPLVRLWRAATQSDSEPDPAAIAAARAGCAPQAWRPEGDAVVVTRPGLAFDLGGLAKGFAVDQACALLRARGIADILVQVGGETACAGRAPAGGRHRIGVPHPDDPDGSWCAILADPGDGLCGSTSGDYRQGFAIAGILRHHILDPRSGRPVETAVTSATCICRGAGRNALVDGLSTALSVRGPTALPSLAAAAGCEGCLLRRDPQRGLLASATAGWRDLLAPDGG